MHFQTRGEKLFLQDDKKFDELIDYLKLDENKELGTTFGTTGGGYQFQ